MHAEEYEEHLSATQYTHYDGGKDWPTRTEQDASGLGEVTQSLRSLAYYHHDVFVFHSHFLNDSEHTYASKPSGWLLLNRPVGVSADIDIKPGTQGCDAPPGSDCLRQVLLLGTPGDLVGRDPGAAVRRWWRGSAPGTGASAWPSSGAATDLAAVAGVRRPADLLVLRGRSRCRSWSWRSRWPWAS